LINLAATHHLPNFGFCDHNFPHESDGLLGGGS
jgi:hypothetical protein